MEASAAKENPTSQTQKFWPIGTLVWAKVRHVGLFNPSKVLNTLHSRQQTHKYSVDMPCPSLNCIWSIPSCSSNIFSKCSCMWKSINTRNYHIFEVSVNKGILRNYSVLRNEDQQRIKDRQSTHMPLQAGHLNLWQWIGQTQVSSLLQKWKCTLRSGHFWSLSTMVLQHFKHLLPSSWRLCNGL